jgi:hypothetical protein
MSFAAVESIVRAVLYEGYLLYPYRTSALKNRQRWLFGRLLPREYALSQDGSEPWQMRIEFLVEGSGWTSIESRLRFLQLLRREQDSESGAESKTVERQVSQACTMEQILDRPLVRRFEFDARLEGTLQIEAAECRPGLFKLMITAENLTPTAVGQDLDRVLEHALLSTLTVLRFQDGRAISLTDPPPQYRNLAQSCQNIGVWPVLVGPPTGSMILAAPIILGDYPQVAPESPGDSFDGTEIDELLALRIQTLTDAEKRAMLDAGEHTQGVLERAERLTEDQRLNLHGRLRMGNAQPCTFQAGDRVRLRPRRGADAMDIVLSGGEATIVAVELDLENRVHLAVVMDDDPGRDLGIDGLPGHRFFFGVDEVERL